MVMSMKSMTQVMLDQEDKPDSDYTWLTYNDKSTCYSRYREHILGMPKGSETPHVQGTKYSKKYLFMRVRVPIRNESS